MKKLTIKSIKHKLVVDLKNLRLEYLDCIGREFESDLGVGRFGEPEIVWVAG